MGTAMRAEATAHLAAHDSRGALLMSLGGNHYKHSRRSWLSQTAVFLILCQHKFALTRVLVHVSGEIMKRQIAFPSALIVRGAH